MPNQVSYPEFGLRYSGFRLEIELMLRRLLYLLLLVSPNAIATEWMGHLAKLEDAKVACRDIDSVECRPFLAQAVAVADVMISLTHYAIKGGEEEILLPNHDQGTFLYCGRVFVEKMNGETLLYMTLARDNPFYWTEALLATVYQLCGPVIRQ
jgi:hypothetical protein